MEAHAKQLKKRRDTTRVRRVGEKLVVSKPYLMDRMVSTSADDVEHIVKSATNDLLAGLEKKYGYGPLFSGMKQGLDKRTLLVVLREIAALQREEKEINKEHQNEKMRKGRRPLIHEVKTTPLDRLLAVLREKDLLEEFLGSRLGEGPGNWRTALQRLYGIKPPAPTERVDASHYFKQIRQALKKRKSK